MSDFSFSTSNSAFLPNDYDSQGNVYIKMHEDLGNNFNNFNNFNDFLAAPPQMGFDFFKSDNSNTIV